MKTIKQLHSLAVFAAFTAAPAHANLIAYEGFDYAPSGTITGLTGGTSWTGAWTGVTNVSGIALSGTDKSLAFNQAPPDGLITDGSTHGFTTNLNSANTRTFTGVSLGAGIPAGSQPFYFTSLIRFGSGANVVDMRAEFSRADGLVRANVGISNGLLFVASEQGGYLPSGNVNASGLVSNDTTYLLAMKRLGTGGIFASLIPANGSIPTEEPFWQVNAGGNSGVTLERLNFIINGFDGGTIRVDELRIATTWASAVGGLSVVPEPTTALAGLLLTAGLIRRRR